MTDPKTPLLETRITLIVPVPVTGADGKEAKRDSITMRRPQTRHAKRLAVVIGADLVRILLADDAVDENGKVKIAREKIAGDLITVLMSQDRLDALTGIVADMCGETAELIDALDLVDLFAVAKAFTNFFPSLQSFASTISQPS